MYEYSRANHTGQLWEQYILSERIKNNAYQGYFPQYFFWRTYDGQEIDLIESHNGKLTAFECKWKIARLKSMQRLVKPILMPHFPSSIKTNI